MLHGCPPSPDAWGRLNVVTPFHHLSGDSHINSSLRPGPLRHLALADRAKKRRSAALHHAPDGAFAARRGAAFAGAVVDAEIVLEIAELAVGAAVIAQRGAA